MIVIFIRSTIIFLTLMIVMRLMGKRQIGEMQPYEFIVTLIIADLACIPMADVSIPLIYGIIAILGLFLLHQFFSLLEQAGDKFKLIISGKPSVVINKNGVDVKELKKNNMGLDDLIESMRSSGYFALDSLDYALFESNGKLSALENPNYNQTETSIPLLLVSDGKIEKTNMKTANTTSEKIEGFLKENDSKLKATEILTVDGNGRAYLKSKNTKYKILQFPLEESVKW